VDKGVSAIMVRWADHVARMWEKRNAYRIPVGKPAGKKSLEGGEDNIKMYCK